MRGRRYTKVSSVGLYTVFFVLEMIKKRKLVVLRSNAFDYFYGELTFKNWQELWVM